MYEVFEHTADLGLRMRAGSLEELLAEAARAEADERRTERGALKRALTELAR